MRNRLNLLAERLSSPRGLLAVGVLVVIIATVSTLVSCADGGLREAREQTLVVVSALEEKVALAREELTSREDLLADINTLLESLPTNHPHRERVLALRDEALELIDQLGTELGRLELELREGRELLERIESEGSNDIEALGEVIAHISRYVPTPYGELVGLAGGLLALLGGSVARKKSLEAQAEHKITDAIVSSIELAKEKGDGVVDFNDSDQKVILNFMGPDARRRVDEIQAELKDIEA